MGPRACLSLLVMTAVLLVDAEEPCREGPTFFDCTAMECSAEGPPYNDGTTCTYRCVSPCTGTGSTFTCNYGAWIGDAPRCHMDGCASSPCHADATCTDTLDGYTCTCNDGYSGDGETCTDIDECTTGTDNCHDDATCTNTVGSFTCSCNEGYAGDGVNCDDIDECAHGADNCHNQATCIDTDGSFICTCNEGYDGDGVNCDEQRDGCDSPPEFDCTTRTGCSVPYAEGATCNYRCNNTCTGEPSFTTRTCENGRWVGDDWGGCSPITCQFPVLPPSPTCVTSTCTPGDFYNFNTVCYYECAAAGCTGVATPTTCGHYGAFQGSLPECLRVVSCGSPPTFACTIRTCTGSDQGDVCTYECNFGCYGSPSTMTRTCEDGAWVGAAWTGCQEVGGCFPPYPLLPTDFDYEAATSAITSSRLDPDVAAEVGMDSFLTDLATYAEYDGTPLADLPDTDNITIIPERWALTYTNNGVSTALFLPETRNFDPEVGLPDELPSVAITAFRQTYPLYYEQFLSSMEADYRNSRTDVEFDSATYGPDTNCSYPPRTDLGGGFALERISTTLCQLGVRFTEKIHFHTDIPFDPVRQQRTLVGVAVSRCCDTAPPDHPPCVEAVCGYQQPPYPNGYQCGYTCARNCTGYYSTLVTCRDGTWVGEIPNCWPLYCKPAPEFDCTTRSGCSAPYVDGETCTYMCNDTCTGEPSTMTRTCTQGIWTGEPWKGCHGDCGIPPFYWCTIRTDCDAPYYHGETCKYVCDRERGCTGNPDNSFRTCIDGTWVGPKWRGCWPRKCGNPPFRNWAVYTCDQPGSPYPSGTMCTYRCRRGCSAIPATTVATCHNGRWYGNRSWRCKRGCGAPPQLDCTKISGCSPLYTYGESCHYRCHNEGGYAMEIAGNAVRTCVWPGVWSGTDLVCECKEREDCCRPDIIFALDYSGSMWQEHTAVKNFVYELVNRFDIGDLDARVGVLRYTRPNINTQDDGIHLEFHLKEYDNEPDTLAAIIPGITATPGGGEDTANALSYVANTMLLPLNGNRADAPDVVIVVTDGYSPPPVTGPASVLHSMGVQTFAIGLGSCVNDAQLHEIANCDDHVYKLADVSGLRGIITNIHNQICCDKPRGVCRYHGCVRDYPVRKFPHSPLWYHPAMTGELCWKHCQEQGYPYSATEYYRQCFCGTTQNFNNLGPRLPDSQCNTPCSGNPNEMCGGVWRMSVYHSSDACPENYERVMANGPCLRFSDADDRQTYQQARQTCRDEGARLVVIKSAALDAFIDNRIQTTYNAETWIGLDIEGPLFTTTPPFIYSDGSQLNTGDWNDWSLIDGQPDHFLGIYFEQCVEIRPQFQYQWNNHFCWLLKNYICEKVATPPCCPRPRTYVSDPGSTLQCEEAPNEDVPDV